MKDDRFLPFTQVLLSITHCISCLRSFFFFPWDSAWLNRPLYWEESAIQWQLKANLQPSQLLAAIAAAITALGNVHWLFLFYTQVAALCHMVGHSVTPAWFKHPSACPFRLLQGCLNVCHLASGLLMHNIGFYPQTVFCVCGMLWPLRV